MTTRIGATKQSLIALSNELDTAEKTFASTVDVLHEQMQELRRDLEIAEAQQMKGLQTLYIELSGAFNRGVEVFETASAALQESSHTRTQTNCAQLLALSCSMMEMTLDSKHQRQEEEAAVTIQAMTQSSELLVRYGGVKNGWELMFRALQLLDGYGGVSSLLRHFTGAQVDELYKTSFDLFHQAGLASWQAANCEDCTMLMGLVRKYTPTRAERSSTKGEDGKEETDETLAAWNVAFKFMNSASEVLPYIPEEWHTLSQTTFLVAETMHHKGHPRQAIEWLNLTLRVLDTLSEEPSVIEMQEKCQCLLAHCFLQTDQLQKCEACLLSSSASRITAEAESVRKYLLILLYCKKSDTDSGSKTWRELIGHRAASFELVIDACVTMAKAEKYSMNSVQRFKDVEVSVTRSSFNGGIDLMLPGPVV